MVSLESDVDICERAKFNKPYKCIVIENRKSSNYVSRIELGKPTIFWLDYTDPSELGSQFADFCTLIDKMNTGDIIRITLNASPSTLGGNQQGKNDNDIRLSRLEELKERIRDYVPSTATIDDMTSGKYPLLLLSCLKKAAGKTFTPSTYREKRLIPLFSSCYADGQQMITLAAIVIDNADSETKIKECFGCLRDYVNFEWDKPSLIQVPELTAKEIIHINNELPNKSSVYEIKAKFAFAFQNSANLDDAIESYVRYYKHYPNFHHVNL
jgi:hypothetical protein